jgi:hypothetical protein
VGGDTAGGRVRVGCGPSQVTPAGPSALSAHDCTCPHEPAGDRTPYEVARVRVRVVRAWRGCGGAIPRGIV